MTIFCHENNQVYQNNSTDWQRVCSFGMIQVNINDPWNTHGTDLLDNFYFLSVTNDLAKWDDCAVWTYFWTILFPCHYFRSHPVWCSYHSGTFRLLWSYLRTETKIGWKTKRIILLLPKNMQGSKLNLFLMFLFVSKLKVSWSWATRIDIRKPWKHRNEYLFTNARSTASNLTYMYTWKRT